MLDFLYSADESHADALESALRAVAVDRGRASQVFRGCWGCLCVAGSPYPSFQVVETDTCVIVVLGGPLPRYDDRVAGGELEDDGTLWLLDAWQVRRRIRWERDLVGHFAALCVDKCSLTVESVTDICSFVPLYVTTEKQTGVVLIGSHLDAVALAAGRVHDTDDVSIADFILHSTVTYPHTLYSGVAQLPPASTHTLQNGRIHTDSYWVPQEGEVPGTLRDCADMLRSILVSNVDRMCAGQAGVGVLLSAGEDSRVVAAVARRCVPTEGITFSDIENRETKIAQRVARTLGVGWSLVLRTPTHYLDRVGPSMLLGESHRRFLDAHAVGLLEDWPQCRRMLGGQFADTYLKGYYARRTTRAGICLKVEDDSGDPGPVGEWPYAEEVKIRRAAHRKTIGQFRESSAGEWARLWPASHLFSLSHLAANRRMYASYEPFVDAAMIGLAARLPTKWKVNRRLFHMAVMPLLKSTWFIPHARGFFPYFGLPVNAPLQALGAARSRALSLLTRHKATKRNEGPWPDYQALAQSDAFSDQLASVLPHGSPSAESSVWVRVSEYARSGSLIQRFNALQMLRWARWCTSVA